MKVLLVGGSGNVGTFVTPYLARKYDLRVFDIRPPSHDNVEFTQGSVTDPDACHQALDGVDAFLWMVMKSPQGGTYTHQTLPVIIDNYTVNNLGLHLFLFTAAGLNVKRGVYTSTMSVHHRERKWYPNEEETPLDTPSVYGLSKGFGELICRYFARWFDMNLIGLRITGPRAREKWLAERRDPPEQAEGHLYVTDEEDLANAYAAALDAVQIGHGRFDPIFIAGDEDQKEHNLSKAKRLLGWEPRSHKLYLTSQ